MEPVWVRVHAWNAAVNVGHMFIHEFVIWYEGFSGSSLPPSFFFRPQCEGICRSGVSVVKKGLFWESALPRSAAPLAFFLFFFAPFCLFFFLSTAHLKSRVIKRKNLDQAFKHCSVICPPRKVFYASPLLPSLFPPALGLYTSLCLLNALMHDGLNLIDVQRASARAPLACARTHVREWWIEHVWSSWLDFIRVFSSPSFFNILCFYTYISISRSDLTRFHLSLSFYSHPQRGMC